jgi:hypothetical protein
MSNESHDPIELMPVALIAVEVGETPDAVAHRFREVLVLDDIGMRAVAVDVARRFFAERAEQAAEIRRRQAESMRRLKEQEAKRPKVRAIPAPAGAPIGSALAVLRSADGDDREWLYGDLTGGGR